MEDQNQRRVPIIRCEQINLILKIYKRITRWHMIVREQGDKVTICLMEQK